MMNGLDLIRRIKARWTQWDLAKELGMHPARISEMETGRRDITEDVEEAVERILPAQTGG